LPTACEIAGQIGEAVTLLDDALQMGVVELNRLKCRLLLRQGRDAAQELYRKV